MGIEGGGLDAAMSEQNLDRSQIGPRLQEMGGEAVSEGMDGHVLAQPCRVALFHVDSMSDYLIKEIEARPPPPSLFVLIGGGPSTQWLPKAVQLEAATS